MVSRRASSPAVAGYVDEAVEMRRAAPGERGQASDAAARRSKAESAHDAGVGTP